jgi:SprT-like family
MSERNLKKVAEIIPLFRTKQMLCADWHSVDPTTQTYAHLTHAFGFLNRELFDSQLPPALITFHQKKGMMGHFRRSRYKSFDGVRTADEIALNPLHFALGDVETLSTLAHEMVHLWQYDFGKITTPGDHNKEWAAKMMSIGLTPSDTAAAGGKQTGRRMSHFIEPGGKFARAANELIEKGFVVAFVEQASPEQELLKMKKLASKTRFECSGCGQLAWAKPGSQLDCRRCQRQLLQV